jgi:UDP-glucose 4-epimerase
VRELVRTFERVYGQPVPVQEAPPRPGDAVGAFANVDKAADVLGWRSTLTLDQAIASALAWGRKRKAVLGYD